MGAMFALLYDSIICLYKAGLIVWQIEQSLTKGCFLLFINKPASLDQSRLIW